MSMAAWRAVAAAASRLGELKAPGTECRPTITTSEIYRPGRHDPGYEMQAKRCIRDNITTQDAMPPPSRRAAQKNDKGQPEARRRPEALAARRWLSGCGGCGG